jgi:NTE family protein
VDDILTDEAAGGALGRPGTPVTLALQGGGSHGAFAWGVLDRLLDEAALDIAVVSGASAGAMNAAMLAQGLGSGGRGEAKRLLEAFWRRVAVASGSPDLPGGAWLGWMAGMMAPMTDAMRQGGGLLSRRQLNPMGLNPLRDVLDGLFDPAALGRSSAPALVVAATRVRTGEARLFRDAEVTTKALLASACLPQLFPAVEIDGEAYWDGGYASNPPLRALIEAGAPADLVLVRTTPVARPEVPSNAAEVQDRSNEMTFGAGLRGELRTLAFAQRVLMGRFDLPEVLARLRDARLHSIGAEDAFRALPGGSRADPSWAFLTRMRQLGGEAAEAWLAAHSGDVGRRSSLDLAEFAAPPLTSLVPAASRVSAAGAD